MFWTDETQAAQRLSGCFLLHDGKPFYCRSVDRNEEGVLCAYGNYSNNPTWTFFPLDDEKWGSFRSLPPIGWSNLIDKKEKVQAALLRRFSRVSTRHGLYSDNTIVLDFLGNSSGSPSRSPINNTSSFMKNKGYLETVKDETNFPRLSDTLAYCKEDQAIAISRKFCVQRDREGMRWFFRGVKKVGMFSGMDTLNLFKSKTFLKEELADTPSFDINTVQEF